MTQSTKKPVTVSHWIWLAFFNKQVHFSRLARTAANSESKLSLKTLLKFLKAWIDLLSLQSNESYSTLLVCSSSHSQIVSCLVRLSLFCEAFFSCNRIIKHSVDYCVVIFHLKHVFTCRIICKFNVNFISCCSKRSSILAALSARVSIEKWDTILQIPFQPLTASSNRWLVGVLICSPYCTSLDQMDDVSEMFSYPTQHGMTQESRRMPHWQYPAMINVMVNVLAQWQVLSALRLKGL